MRNWLVALFLVAPLVAVAQPVFPPATQAEVDAGTIRSKFVSPYTLQHATLSGITVTATNAVAKTDGVATNTYMTNATIAVSNATADRILAAGGAKQIITTSTSRFLFDNFFFMGISNIVAANTAIAIGTNGGTLWITNMGVAAYDLITNQFASGRIFTNNGHLRQSGGLIMPSLVADRAMIVDANNNATSHVQITASELSSLDGITGVIEDRLKTFMPSINGSSTNQLLYGLPAFAGTGFKITNGWFQIGTDSEITAMTNWSGTEQKGSFTSRESGQYVRVQDGASFSIEHGSSMSLGANGGIGVNPTYILVGTNDYFASGDTDDTEANRFRFSRDSTPAVSTNLVMRWLATSNLVFSMVGGAGEANVLGHTATTNTTTRFALENDKSGVTNLIKTLSSGMLMVVTNETTNLVFAVNAASVTNIATNSVKVTGSGGITVTPSGTAGGFTYDISGGGGSPVGVDTSVQVKSNGLFQGASELVYDFSNRRLQFTNQGGVRIERKDTGTTTDYEYNGISTTVGGFTIETLASELILTDSDAQGHPALYSGNGATDLGSSNARWRTSWIEAMHNFGITNRMLKQPWVAAHALSSGVVGFGNTNSWSYLNLTANTLVYLTNCQPDTVYYLAVTNPLGNTLTWSNASTFNWLSGYPETAGTNGSLFAFVWNTFFNTTNAWVEGKQELGLKPYINSQWVTNGNDLHLLSGLTVATNGGTAAFVTNLYMTGAGSFSLSNDASGKATLHLNAGGAAGNPGGAEASLQVKMGSTFVGSSNALYDVTNSVLTSSNFGFQGWSTNWYRAPTITATTSNVLCDGSIASNFKLNVGGFGVTNFVFTNLQVGQTITLETFITNGTYARILLDATEATAEKYVGANGTVPLLNSNAFSTIRVTRTVGPSATNIVVSTRDLVVTPGYGMTYTTNVAAGIVTQNVASVIANLALTGAPYTNQYEYLFIPAGSMISNATHTGVTTSGATNATLTSATTNRTFDAYIFSGATTASNAVQAHFALPLDWDTNTLPQVKLFYTSTNGVGATQTNVWGVSMASTVNDGVVDQAMGTELTITNVITAANDLMVTSATQDLTPGGVIVANSFVTVQIRRLGNNANDNAQGDARLLGAWVRWRRHHTQSAVW